MSPETILNLLVAGAVSYLWWKIRHMETKLENTYSKLEVRQLIEDLVHPVNVELRNMKDSVGKLDHKLDRLIDLISRSNDK